MSGSYTVQGAESQIRISLRTKTFSLVEARKMAADITAAIAKQEDAIVAKNEARKVEAGKKSAIAEALKQSRTFTRTPQPTKSEMDRTNKVGQVGANLGKSVGAPVAIPGLPPVTASAEGTTATHEITPVLPASPKGDPSKPDDTHKPS